VIRAALCPGHEQEYCTRLRGIAEEDFHVRPTIGIEDVQRAAAATLHEHWVLFLVEGVVLLVLGATAVVLPPIATLAVTILFGWLFLVSGIVGLVTTFWMRHAPGFWWSLVSAVLAIVVGVLLLASPLIGAFSLTLVLIAFFLVEGAVSIMFALDHRRELSGQWVGCW
jgi:uncharacterized membrane protein HdeD (DUF308 family)